MARGSRGSAGTGFLTVVSRDEARRLWRAACPFAPREGEEVPLAAALGRVLARDLESPEDVPSFRRADRDGFAVRAADTWGASEHAPRALVLSGEGLTPGREATGELPPGGATRVATGAAVPRGADAVLMVEDSLEEGGAVLALHAVVPGENLTQAGTDLARGECVGRAGDLLTARETAVLAACGVAAVPVRRRPRVAVLSTGDEIVGPGAPPREGFVRDVNSRAVADAVRAAGGEPEERGVVPDRADALEAAVAAAAAAADLVLLSGGTSKGAGDLAAGVLGRMEGARVVVHGVALKPGKPLLLAVVRGTPLAVLPGFPTSAIFTFHEFVAPEVRRMAGLPERDPGEAVRARLAVRLRSKKGFLDFSLVDLVAGRGGLLAWPVGKGSGSITTWARSDGFLAVPEDREQLEAGEEVEVVPLAPGRPPADLSVVGSHCRGAEILLRLLRERTGRTAKVIHVGSTAGLEAARRGACDLAGVHLLDGATGEYNAPFLPADGSVLLARGWGRRQGFVFRPGDARFEGRTAEECAAAAAADPSFLLAQRNRGSGTRILVDSIFRCDTSGMRGGDAELRTHAAVCAAVRHGKADGGIAEEASARAAGLGFAFWREERYDFAIPADRADRAAVREFLELLRDPAARAALRAEGFPD
ncbi:MAG: molybdopterin biosynthesis protein [Planctomycetes bacterium]|nr:molybdopterin biosynthesis protein [Planctomycetota bacterium]